MQLDAFLPTANGSLTIAVTATSAQTAVLSAGSFVEINNAGTVTVFVEQDAAGNNPTAVVATSYPVLSGQSKIIRRFNGVNKLAIIGASAGPTTVYVSPGEGV